MCSVAREHSRRGGKSLRDLLADARYRELRSEITSATLREYLAANPTVVDEWKAYSEDKRTRGGWHLTGSGESWEIGRAEGGGTLLYGSGEEACAEFILRELDFWTALA
jgi:hypothetical protein